MPLTYPRAKLIIWNSDAYDRAEVRRAAVFVLGSLSARDEDIAQASSLL